MAAGLTDHIWTIKELLTTVVIPTAINYRVGRQATLVEQIKSVSCVVVGDKKARQTFEGALNKVLPVTTTVVEKLRGMASKPDKIEVTFGVNLSTMVGAVIASDSSAANFGVTVRWTGTHKETTP